MSTYVGIVRSDLRLKRAWDRLEMCIRDSRKTEAGRKHLPYRPAPWMELWKPVQSPCRTSAERDKADNPQVYRPTPIRCPNKGSLSLKRHHRPAR